MSAPSRLFHFSEEEGIDVFVPRAVKVPSKRKPGKEWLNGPLVWAIDEWHQPMYLFPRDCPRILMWPTPRSSKHDIDRYFAGTEARIIVYVEHAWEERIQSTTMYRYEFPVHTFESLNDAGMWVSRETIVPLGKESISNLAQVLEQQNVELRKVDTLTPFRDLWQTTLHVSGIRLRNAINWT